MPTQRRFEGPTLAAVLAKVQKEAGTNPQIISAQKVRSGGFLGFFQRERFEVIVEVSPVGSGHSASALQKPPPRPTSLLDLAEQTNQQESRTIKAATPPQAPTPSPAPAPAVAPATVAAAAAPASAAPAQDSDQPDLRDPAVRAALLARAREERLAIAARNEDLPEDPAPAPPQVETVQPSTVAPAPAPAITPAPTPAPTFAEVLNRLAFQQPQQVQQPQPTPEPEPEPESVAAQPAPQPEPEPAVEPVLEAEPKPQSEPEPEPEPEPVASVVFEDELPEEQLFAEPLSSQRNVAQPNVAQPNVAQPNVAQANIAQPNAATDMEPQIAEPLRTRATDAPLAKLGLPALYVRELPTTNEAAELQKAIAEALQDLPKSPTVTPSRGSVIAVVGERNESTLVAKDLLTKWNRPHEELVFASEDSFVSVDEVGEPRIISTVSDAENCARSWSRRQRPTVVVIVSPLGSGSSNWTELVLEALEPIATYAVADATRKSEDISAWIESVGGVDAIALNHVEQTVSPASVLATQVPIDRIDGRTATPELWAMLLAERLVNS